MNKQAFLDELGHYLNRVPAQDRTEMLQDFEEHFAIGIAVGKSEQELAQELGNPQLIARELLADYRDNQPATPSESKAYQPEIYPHIEDKRTSSITRSIIVAIALLFFNLIFVIGPAAAIFSVYVAFAAVGLTFTLSPVLWIGTIISGFAEQYVSEFFVVMTLCSLGVLLSIGMLYIGKLLFRALINYIKFNVRVVKG
ncbi:HAAS signaling domain-containing protein [Radiobacillus sp. PE A8.2]|uniref:HAAS signaling domain-containing protein n=1 Tax=Radiobacillus sp. PE A8.2 TaxID=3380349 RepID=UPI003890353E